MLTQIRKRDGSVDSFCPEKIACAIFKAAAACGGSDFARAQELTNQVIALVEEEFCQGSNPRIPDVESVQDLVETILIKGGHARTARAFIRYRQKRSNERNRLAMIRANNDLFSAYLGDKDWRIKENANTQKSINGLNNYIRENFTKNYWLHEIYSDEVRDAHESGDIHIHDLGFLGPYCAGWDLQQLLILGFGGVPGKVESRPARHLHSFLGQIVNSTFTTQGECAGAQAWSSFDTFCAPFIRKDNLSFEDVKQCLQEFIFNINVPTRVGFQCPFSNLTFDITIPKTLRDRAVIMGGEATDDRYGDFQAEMNLFNRAFCEVMMEGDAKGRVFTFPIPTLNITPEFDWDAPAVDAFMQATCKYGIPYFANYVNSELSPEDAVSMCCRLRLDTTKLQQRGGGLFGSNPLTGSIGVVTINLARIGYLSRSRHEFKERLLRLIHVSKTSLETKRKVIEHHTENGLYPYSAHYLGNIKRRTGQYWFNHFSTIGVVGMNEALLNFMECGIAEPEGQAFALEILHFMRDALVEIQQETQHVYNLEATPAEGTAYRFARKDRELHPGIITAGIEAPYYTNSTQLPVGQTTDLFEALDLQDDLQSVYTGGTVLHAYLGESIEDTATAKRLIQKVFNKYRLPYLSLTPTFSICPAHGYIRGEHFDCPTCNGATEVWSRVTGYLRPVDNYNDGKKAEYFERRKFVLEERESGAHGGAHNKERFAEFV